MVLLMLNLWDKRVHQLDNRSMETAGAPLLPFLHRFAEISVAPSNLGPLQDGWDEEKVSCTKLYLDMLDLPGDETVEVDLKQACLFVMSRLDQLAVPHMPPLCFNKVISKYIHFLIIMIFFSVVITLEWPKIVGLGLVELGLEPRTSAL